MHYPTFGHEIMSTLFFNVNINDTKGCSLFYIDMSIVHLGGSADVDGFSRMTADHCGVDGQPFQGYAQSKLS